MKYILYARKSSESEDRQALSIDSQINELLKLAEKEDRKVDKIFKESMSAKKMGRPIFNEMLEFIGKQKDCVVLAWKVDRLTRNIFDGAKIIELLENGNIKEIRTIDKVIMDNPIDKFMLSIDFGVGKKYSDDLSVNVKRGNRAKLEKGEWPGVAPFGYLNDKINKTIIIDSKREKYIEKMFILCAKNYSVKEIANHLYKKGLRNRGGNKIGKSTIHRLLNNPLYYGVMLRDGKYYQGKHEPIITKQLFDQAQDTLLGKNHSKKQKHFYPYRGFMTCSVCGCVLTPDKRKGHVYYYCTNGKGNCEQHKKYLRSEEVDKLIANALKKLEFNIKFIEISYRAAKEKLAKRKDNSDELIATIEKQLKTNEERQSRLLDRHLDNSVSEDAYKAKSKQLEKDRIDLESELKRIEQKSGRGNSTFEPAKNIFLRANKAQKDFLKAKEDGKRHLLEIMLSNLFIESGNVADISFKMPYQMIANAPKNCDLQTMLGR